MPNHLENQEKGIMINVLLWKEKSAILSVSIEYYKWNVYMYVFNLFCKLCVHNLENGYVDIYILEVTWI